MASYNPVVKNASGGAIFYVSLLSRDSSGVFQTNPTLASGDVKISKDGGSLNNLGTLPSVSPAGSKVVKVTLSQAETNADNLAIVFSDQAGDEWCDLTVGIRTTAKQFDDLSTQVSVDDLPTNAELVTALADLPTNSELATALAAADDAVLAAIAALVIPTANANADALLDRANAIETGLTLRQAMRVFAAALGGKASGLGTATAVFRNAQADSKDRITATVDADGNRSAVSLDVS